MARGARADFVYGKNVAATGNARRGRGGEGGRDDHGAVVFDSTNVGHGHIVYGTARAKRTHFYHALQRLHWERSSRVHNQKRAPGVHIHAGGERAAEPLCPL